MAWLDKIQSDFTITCGDGSSFTALWINATKAKEYNLTVFDFPGVSGSLAKRKLPRGRRYNIEIIFQGEDHLDTAEAFERSADDPNPWNISHPLYGSILVQPIALIFDNTAFNVTRITGQIIETITEDAPSVTLSAADKIAADKEEIDEIMSLSYSLEVPTPTVADATSMLQNVESMYAHSDKLVNNAVDAEDLLNAYNRSKSLINSSINEPLLVLRQMQSLASMPSRLATSVQNRLNTLVSQLASLGETVENILGLNKSSKALYQANAGTLITTMALATVTNAEYSNRAEALDAMDIILEAHDTYLTTLDALQSENGGVANAFIPDPQALEALGRLVSTTVSNLFQAASEARQERAVYLADDTNLIELAHRLYGLQPDDSTIDRVIRENNIGLNEILQLRKGRRIVYYV